MKLKIFATILISSAIVFVVRSATKTNEFAPAEMFPRGALIYAQAADLPALVKLWNESDFKAKYERSANAETFSNSHLGLKLASRLGEFEQAGGFPFDLETVAALADKRAAVALYDIGKIEFVFVAPMSDEVFAATKFAQNQMNFEEQTLDDKTIIYRARVEADRGRQRQDLIFCHLKNHFIVATSETLLGRTLENINGKSKKTSLADEPTFAALAGRTAPRLATVWANQTALNDDYYFKHYWLGADEEKLKNIRAGIFDFSIKENNVVERRRFLLAEKINSAAISAPRVAETLAFLPEEIPFYQMRKAAPTAVDQTIEATLFDRPQTAPESNRRHDYYSNFSFSDDEDYSDYYDYSHLDSDFDQAIDESEEIETTEKSDARKDFSTLLQTANPQAILTFTEPEVLPAPLFVQFKRAAIFNLDAAGKFNRQQFETAIAERFSRDTTIKNSGASLVWETKGENDWQWRELDLPMLGAGAVYAVRGDCLILTNDADFLQQILADKSAPKNEIAGDAPFVRLSVLNLNERANAFDDVFAELDEGDATGEFFTGNISSLLDSISEFKRVEIRENYREGFLEQTITASR